VSEPLSWPRARYKGSALERYHEDQRELRAGQDAIVRTRALQPTALYRHFDADGKLLYVGISLSVVARLARHVNGSHWARQITMITIEWHSGRPEALAAEAAAIVAERPAFNIAGVPSEGGSAP
jgi:predicted GIY-YIG superfamily endonuclease